jgi:hypothetical protein
MISAMKRRSLALALGAALLAAPVPLALAQDSPDTPHTTTVPSGDGSSDAYSDTYVATPSDPGDMQSDSYPSDDTAGGPPRTDCDVYDPCTDPG